ncbi:TonB-linked SusC/RagA family outer membrane protein [Pedobacter sp. W3I1]|uniref:SusC/RagA family TonB-linked outer membrane protein n=1 Tax=Pedobacter sp. W3I1 TaxID=3042291 RepID=UPI00278193C7|nr:TonB-dependent receptor [Pedobacter sp. W3I1]MDQ0641286.1 TonB-linked SusC/RagA family outer membrane protein [Pedobacter sp. W3I1]
MKQFYLQLVVLAILSCFLFLNQVSAQSKVKVQGVVKNTEGVTMPGATVKVKDGTQGVTTNTKGEFSINVETGKTLIFNFIGYQPHAHPVSKNETITITLTELKNNMDDVVVIGYGVQKKSHVTGAVSRLKNDNLDEIPTSRLDNALIGKLAGLTIQNITSEAGSDPTLRVRGSTSLSANADPLVVVDGQPIADGMAFINSYDVESIDVLKDAASAAIYGSRGANGVILITTKKGVADKPKYTFKTFYGIKEAYELHPLMTTSEYTSLLFEEAAQRMTDPSVTTGFNKITDLERTSYVIENQISGTATNWQQEGLRNAAIYNVQLGVSGGSKNLRYYISGNMQQDQGVMKYSENNKGNIRVKIDANLSPKLALSVNLNPTYTKTQKPANTYIDYYRWYSSLPVYHTAFTAAFVDQTPQWSNIRSGDYVQARHFASLNYAGFMPDGSYWASSGALNPFSTSNNTPVSIASRETRFSEVYRVQGGADLSYTFSKGLIFKSSLSGYYSDLQSNVLTQSNARKDGDVNSGTIYNSKNVDVLWENTLNYIHSIGKHNFTGLLGYTMQKTTQEISNMVGLNSPTDDFTTLAQAAQIDQGQTYTAKVGPVGLISYLGRINYDYNGKYLFSASLRTDGSSKFSTGNKYGWFPAVSAGWVISSEKFMEGSKNWLSGLKLRASYGETGNNRIADFSFEDLLYKANYSFGEGTGNVNAGQAPNGAVIAGRNITWETNRSANLGLDISLLKNRIILGVEYYYSTTKDLLLQQGTESFTGSDSYWNNNGTVRNKGIEIELSSTNINNKAFRWNTSLNFAANRNKLIKLGGEPYQYNYGVRNEIYASIVGGPAVQFFGYQTDGVWLSQADITASGQTGSILSNYLTPGSLKIVDQNGDHVIDEKDRTGIGSPYPDFTWGITNTFRYKNFDLSILLQGSQGGDLINGDVYYNETRRYDKAFTDNRWVSEAFPGDGKTPYYGIGTYADVMLTDFVVEDASYAYLRNVILGYTFKPAFLKKVKVNSLRIFSSADNVYFITGKSYRGINPEARITSGNYSSPLVSGYQSGGFPVNRTFTFGIDLNF